MTGDGRGITQFSDISGEGSLRSLLSGLFLRDEGVGAGGIHLLSLSLSGMKGWCEEKCSVSTSEERRFIHSPGHFVSFALHLF